MITSQEEVLYQQAVNLWGQGSQATQLLHHMAALQVKVCDLFDERILPSKLVGDLADVTIMIEAMATGLSLKDDYIRSRRRKLRRLKRRVAFGATMKDLEGQVLSERELKRAFGYAPATLLAETALADYIVRTAPDQYMVLGKHIDELGEEEGDLDDQD